MTKAQWRIGGPVHRWAGTKGRAPPSPPAARRGRRGFGLCLSPPFPRARQGKMSPGISREMEGRWHRCGSNIPVGVTGTQTGVRMPLTGSWQGWGAWRCPLVLPGSGGISCSALVSARGAWHSPARKTRSAETCGRRLARLVWAVPVQAPRAGACASSRAVGPGLPGAAVGGQGGAAGAGTGTSQRGRGRGQVWSHSPLCSGVPPWPRVTAERGSTQAVVFNPCPRLGLADSPLPFLNPSEISLSTIACGGDFARWLQVLGEAALPRVSGLKNPSLFLRY